MVENFKKALDHLKESKEFKEWEKNSKDAYLADGFAMLGEDYKTKLNSIDWQADFYNSGKEEMTSFIVKDDEIESKGEQKVLKSEGHDIAELKLNKIKVKLEEAVNKLEERYPNEKANKVIIILQELKVPVWNITFLTMSFNIAHMKINAENGEIVEEFLKPVIEMKQK